MAAQGDAARRLAEKLLSLSDEALSRLQGMSGAEVLLIVGAASCLPWVDGAVYLGRDPAAPGLLAPTNLEPELPIALLERAILKRVPGLLPPLAILPSSCLILSANSARPLSRPTLQQWLETNR